MTDPELIKAVAEKLGWTKICKSNRHPKYLWGVPPGGHGTRRHLPPWLTSVDAALEVVKDFPIVMLNKVLNANSCELRDFPSKGPMRTFRAEAESLPRAICEAFLKEKP